VSRRGLTLIEVLVAAVVLALGTSALLYLVNALGGQRTAQRLTQVQAVVRSVTDLVRGEWSRTWGLPLGNNSQGEVELRVGPGGDALTSFVPPEGFQVTLLVSGDGATRAQDTVRTVRIRVQDPQGRVHEYATRVARPTD